MLKQLLKSNKIVGLLDGELITTGYAVYGPDAICPMSFVYYDELDLINLSNMKYNVIYLDDDGEIVWFHVAYLLRNKAQAQLIKDMMINLYDLNTDYVIIDKIG